MGGWGGERAAGGRGLRGAAGGAAGGLRAGALAARRLPGHAPTCARTRAVLRARRARRELSGAQGLGLGPRVAHFG